MKKIIVGLSLLFVLVAGAFYLSNRPRHLEYLEGTTIAKTDNWKLWFNDKYPDRSTAWPKDARDSLEQIINGDMGKWNFICKGDLHKNNRPTVLMMKTEDTPTVQIAVKELKVMDYREGKWVELVRQTPEGLFRNNKKIEVYSRYYSYAYQIAFSFSDWCFNINAMVLDSTGNIQPGEGIPFWFDRNKDRYTDNTEEN